MANALCVINTALIALPSHTLLITKKLRILERTCDIGGVMTIVASLRSVTSQRVTAVLLDAVQALARLGQDQSSWIILHTVCTNPECYSGRLYLELLRYCTLSLPFNDTLSLLCDILDHYPKHAPLVVLLYGVLGARSGLFHFWRVFSSRERRDHLQQGYGVGRSDPSPHRRGRCTTSEFDATFI